MKDHSFLNFRSSSGSFISHMVQMKDHLTPLLSQSTLHLYIPHGSDERQGVQDKQALAARFISHMVQMKVRRLANDSWWSSNLYIPHGSDESAAKGPKQVAKELFISHMVQMKGSGCIKTVWTALYFISHMVQMKDTPRWQGHPAKAALYPTWFRWKAWDM